LKRPSQWFPPEVVLGFLIGILFCLAIAGPLSYQASHCSDANSSQSESAPSGENRQAPTTQKQSDGGHGKIEKHSQNLSIGCGLVGFIPSVIGVMDRHEGFFVGGFTFALFAATIALWRSTSSLWDAGERQLKHLETTAERQLRAYVFGNGGGINIQRGGNVPGQRWLATVNFEFKNFGQTPAYKCGAFMKSEMLPAGTKEFPIDATESESVIGPGGTFEKHVNVRFLYDDLTEFYKHSKRIYVWGQVTYMDAFEKPRHFRFYMVDANPSGDGLTFGLADLIGKPHEAN
jgi:hypothetical protein